MEEVTEQAVQRWPPRSPLRPAARGGPAWGLVWRRSRYQLGAALRSSLGMPSVLAASTSVTDQPGNAASRFAWFAPRGNGAGNAPTLNAISSRVASDAAAAVTA